MTIPPLLKDRDNIAFEGQYDANGQQFVAREAGTVSTSPDGTKHAPERVEVSNFPGTQPVSGTVAVSNFPATQPVSVAALPLPSGAATEAGHLATIDTSTAAVSTATGTQADSAWSGSGSGGVIGVLKAIYNKVAGTLAISAASLPLPSNAAKETGGNLATLVTNTTSLAPTAGYAATTSPPSTTNASSDTSYTFAAQVRHWLLQNNTSANVQFELDTTATAGSIVLAPGATWLSDIPVTVLHLYTAAAQNINGSSAGNIVLKGWL